MVMHCVTSNIRITDWALGKSHQILLVSKELNWGGSVSLNLSACALPSCARGKTGYFKVPYQVSAFFPRTV